MKSAFGFVFWLHLFITVLSWFGPFLFWYPVIIAVYAIVILQFIVFKRCLMNREHALGEEDDNTFYAYVLEQLGFKPNRTHLKFFIRKLLYPILIIITLIWQIYLGHKSIIF